MGFPNYKQDDARDCGPACLQMICGYYGKYIELERLRFLCGTTREGSSVADIIKAGGELGLRCTAYKISYFKFRHEVPFPCIILWKGNHFSVVYKADDRHVWVSDPGEGLVRRSLTDFANGWLSPVPGSSSKRGVCITCEPTPEFEGTRSDPKRNGMMDALAWFWKYLKPYSGQAGGILAIALSVTTLGAVFPFLTQAVVDSGIPSRDTNLISLLLVASISLAIGRLLGRWIQSAMTLRLAAKTRLTMASDYVARLFRMPMPWFDNRLAGDIFQRNADFDRIESAASTGALGGILSLLSLLVFGTILLVYNKTLFWTYTACAALYVGWVLVFWEIRKRMDIHYFSLLAKNNSQWFEFITRVSDIKQYRYADGRRMAWERNQVEMFRTRVKLMNAEQAQQLGSGFINALKDSVLIWLSARSVMAGDMTLGMLTAVQYLLGQMDAPLDGAVGLIVSLQLSTISYNRVTDIARASTENDTPTENDTLLPHQGDISLKGVVFRYGTGSWAIDRVDAIFPAGATVAICGESGSGKSTLIKIIAGLYTPEGGTVTVGGMPISSFSVNAWRERCGVVTQESGLVRGTIWDNIVFGREPNDQRIRYAAETASIRAEIEGMPRGYATLIGDNGRGVSEGQKQRILLARALYGNPDYILLDEMSSALDKRNETTITHALHSALRGKTVIIATHSEASAEAADFVIIMRGGKVVEQGTPTFLRKKGQEYNRIFPSSAV